MATWWTKMKYKITKKLATIGIISMLIVSILTTVFTTINYNNYIKSNNEAILRMVSIIIETENLTKDEIVQLFESEETFDLDILQQYGYTLDTKYFLEIQEQNFNKNLAINLTAANLFVLFVLFLLHLSTIKRQKNIDELICYLQELNNKNYSLQINENTEDELSKLKKEIYQITVLLKEQAENSLSDKIAVKDNIVNISHQLKTPLTAISIMLDNIIEYPTMEEKTKDKFILNIRNQALHIEFLLQNLLKLSKFDANVIEFKTEQIKAKDLINHCVNTLQTLLNQKQIKLNISGDESANFIGDFHWQSEAITNIIKNAIEHSNEKGKLEINYSMNNFHTKISIQDHGKGIKKQSQKLIFTRFYKDENSSEESMGVGLSLAKIIVEKGEGSITLKSGENTGSLFEVRYLK